MLSVFEYAEPLLAASPRLHSANRSALMLGPKYLGSVFQFVVDWKQVRYAFE
jgi:hypothetical protein